MPSNPVSFKTCVMLLFHLGLGLPGGLFQVSLPKPRRNFSFLPNSSTFLSPSGIICCHCLTCNNMASLSHLLLSYVSIASPSGIICYHCITCNHMASLSHLLLSYGLIASPAIVCFHCLTFCNHMAPFVTFCNHVASLSHLLQLYGSIVSLQISEIQNHRSV